MLEKEKLKVKEKVKVPSVAKKIDRNEMHLNGPLAYRMLTAFELWREVVYNSFQFVLFFE